MRGTSELVAIVTVALVGALAACTAPADPTEPSAGTTRIALATASPVYLHASGTTRSLDRVAPTASDPATADSRGVHLSGGNPWIEVGKWSSSTLARGTLTGLGAVQVWVGLENSDDIGTNFDVRAEVHRGSALVATGEVLCVKALKRSPAAAKSVSIPFATFSPTFFAYGEDTLSLRIVARIGTNGAGGACGGHASAVGLRAYFDAVDRAAAFATTIEPPPIACTTTISDYFTGEVLETIQEPNVPVRQGSTPSQLVLESEGWRQAMYGSYVGLLSAFPNDEPASYFATLTYGGVPGPTTQIEITRVGDQATLSSSNPESGFVHHARPFLTRFVTFACAVGTTTILPSSP